MISQSRPHRLEPLISGIAGRSNAAESQGLENAGRRGNPVRNLAFLSTLTVVTHLPLLGIGEPDSALFTTGVRQWLSAGSQAPSLYSARACALYYVWMAALVRQLHLPLRDCSGMMSAISLLAGVGIVVFGYLLGSRLADWNSALKGMLLFALSPGFWWVSAESHPQALSLFFGMAAVWFFWLYLEGSNRWWFLTAAVLFALALATKNDAVLLAPGFLAVALWQKFEFQQTWKAIGVAFTGGVLSMLLSRLTAGSAFGAVTGAQQAMSIYGRFSNLRDFAKGLTPIVCGLGLITALALAAALVIAFRKDPARRRWLILLSLWCLPGYLFFIYIWGNNVRHVLAFGIPLFWFAAKYLRWWQVLACVAASLLVPGNSNNFLYPSPNVLASEHLFRVKHAELGHIADTLSSGSSCFVGSYTSDYLVPMLLNQGGRMRASNRATTHPHV